MGLALQAFKIHHISGGVFVALAFFLFLFFKLLKLVRAFTINPLYTSDEAFLEKLLLLHNVCTVDIASVSCVSEYLKLYLVVKNYVCWLVKETSSLLIIE